MLDPVLSLSISVHSNKGVFALLLGSGVSRSSGIPTGWEVLQDLIKRVALLRNEDVGSDPGLWFRRTFGTEPSYSELLAQIAGQSAERSQLLRGYFEPTPDERIEGQKQPTAAHHHIAELVSKGYIRVIVTTNFDRLIEQALSKIGIGATVIASADAVRGALPVAHSTCSIIKVHGDYLDIRLKNTLGELSTYEDPMNLLLDRVFDEYGLIVCGWSAEWDPALRAAMQRCFGRRFSTFWALCALPPNDVTQRLIALRGAAVVTIKGADSFFREIAENVAALESFGATDPISADVAVARLKRFLASDEYRIALSDLLLTEAVRSHTTVFGNNFTVDTPASSAGGAGVLARLRAYEAELLTMVRLMTVSANWAKSEQHDLILSCLTRLTEIPPFKSGINDWISLQWYPALLIFYAIGLSALATGNYGLLKALLQLPIRRGVYNPTEAAAVVLNDNRALPRGTQQELPGREREYTPLLNHMFEFLKAGLQDLRLSPARYDEVFDEFDYIRCLVAWDMGITRLQISELQASNSLLPSSSGTPLGRFFWKDSFYESGGLVQRFAIGGDGQIPSQVNELLSTGLFESGGRAVVDKYQLAKAAIDQTARQRY